MKTILLLSLSFVSLIAQQRSIHAQSPDWSTSIASIVYENCATCHRPGEIAPFSLLSYDDALTYGPSMVEQTSAGLMPPWPADPNYRHYLDEKVLSESDKILIAEWVDNGMPLGDTSLAPDVPFFPTGSQLGVPDTVISMSQAHQIAGDGIDRYMIFVLPSGFMEDKNVTAIEFRPGNNAAVHHAFIYSDTTGMVAAEDALTPEYGFEAEGAGVLTAAEFITLYRPGMTMRFLPENIAYKLPKETDIVLQIHYGPQTIPSSDSTSVNIFFSDDDTVRSVLPLKVTESQLIEPALFIPANTITTFHTEFTLGIGDLSWIGISPHAHLLCSSFKVYGVNPSSDTIPLVNVPNWDFDWQLFYSFTSLQKIEDGTKLYSEGTYDNTVNNPDNPNNPPIDVDYGLSSEDEMFRYFFTAVPYKEGDEFIILDSSLATGSPPVEGIVHTPQLYPCYPNPATDQTMIEFYLPYTTTVTLKLFNNQGQLMEVITDQVNLAAGFHHISLNTSRLTPGIYFCQLTDGNMSRVKPLEVIR